MTKIKEKICEPTQIEVGDFFKIKIKAVRSASYEELEERTYEEVRKFSYGNLKGE